MMPTFDMRAGEARPSMEGLGQGEATFSPLPENLPALGAGLDEQRQAARPCGFLLCADYPVHHELAIARRNGLKVPPRLLVRLELPDLQRCELGFIGLLVRVDTRLANSAQGVRRQPLRLHACGKGKRFNFGDIDQAPNGTQPTLCKADLIRVLIDPLPHAIDPAEAQRFVNRLGPRHAGPA